MSQELWTAVDTYFSDALVPSDDVPDGALAAAAAAGLPPINVAPNQGRLLMILARAIGARRILEIGTLAAYSTIWLARGLPAGGSVVTLEADPRHAEVARANLARAGLDGVVELRQGLALDSLPKLAEEGGAPFDLVFIDADKQNNTAYFNWARKLSRPGSLIITDNVVRNGAVTDASSADSSVQGVRQLVDTLHDDQGVVSTAIQTVGSKGYDGFAISLVV